MPDVNPDFRGLRHMLEAGARPPAFEAIRLRRRQRTRRLGMAGLAAALVVAILGVGYVALGGSLHTQPVIAPSSTDLSAPPTEEDSASGLGLEVNSLVYGPSGGLYLIRGPEIPTGPPSPDNCGTDIECSTRNRRDDLLRSDDLGATWKPVGKPPSGGDLTIANADDMWVAGPGYAAGSSDGGRTWQRWVLAPDETDSLDEFTVSAAEGTAWFTMGPQVFAATNGGRPVKTPSRPPVGNIYRSIAIGADHAMVLGAEDNMHPGTWYETTDHGTHWTAEPGPCAGTPAATSLFPTVTRAPDGSLWALCLALDPIVEQSGWPATPTPMNNYRAIRVSTDAGQTWQDRLVLEHPTMILMTTVQPVSATVAWAWWPFGGNDTETTRTVDGTSWTKVAQPGRFVIHLTAIDVDTAVIIDYRSPSLYVTRDGGASWVPHPIPIGP